MSHFLASVNKEASDAIQPSPMVARRPDVGELVIYHIRQGHQRQGRTRFPALVQGQGERGTLNLTAILEAGELLNCSLVEEIGPGGDSGHVWERPDLAFFTEAFRGQLTSLHTRIGDLEGELAALRKIMLGDYDVPRISFIDILSDFENRLRVAAGGGAKPKAVKGKRK
jgi:hypothetical protein